MASSPAGAAILTALLLLSSSSAATTTTSTTLSSPSSQINSDSILVALLDSQYTELSELIEKALLLPVLEDAIAHHSLTILAPPNDSIHPDLRNFLLEPRHLPSLQSLLLHHVITSSSSNGHLTLSGHNLHLPSSAIVHPDAIIRPDGVIHGIDRVLIPRSVEEAFSRGRRLSAVLPTGAPVVEPLTRLASEIDRTLIFDATTSRTGLDPSPAPALGSSSSIQYHLDAERTGLDPSPAPAPASETSSSIQYHLDAESQVTDFIQSDVIAPGPGLDSGPAPAPGPSVGIHTTLDADSQINDFIRSLLAYGGYNEMADVLVNLTSLATEMGRLVSEGYVLTVLAPNDEAMGRLAAELLAEPGAPERIMYYHLIPEYQTEESMHNAVRRFGRVKYETLRLPHRVVAREADGSVKFGEGEGAAHLFDPDIYTDGRISVQGIDAVLFPPEEPAASAPKAAKMKTTAATVKKRRGKLMEVGCKLLGALGQSSHFTTCQ